MKTSESSIFSTYLKSLVSPDAMEKLYKLRQESRRDEGLRNKLTLMLALLITAVVTSLLLGAAWVPTDVRSYLEGKSDIVLASPETIEWQRSDVLEEYCEDFMTCTEGKNLKFHETTLNEIDGIKSEFNHPTYLFLKLKISKSLFKALMHESLFVAVLPTFNVEQVRLKVNGIERGSSIQGQLLSFGMSQEEFKKISSDNIEATLILRMLPSLKSIGGNRVQDSVLVGSPREIERYRDFLASLRAKGSGRMGDLAKVVLALMCLILFLIVDSSSESLGLALFMGFEAIAMGIGAGFISLNSIGIERTQLVTHFCYQMGDIFKLYFLLQMARVIPTKVSTWLVVGTIVTIPYAYFREYASVENISWAYLTSLYRDTIVGVVGGGACLLSLFNIRDQKLPWRKAALVIAGVAGASEAANSWIAHSNLIRIHAGWQSIYTIYQANIGYLFALGTFLNISTLENRVRSLSSAKTKIDQIERELEIGKIVQKSLLKAPVLPENAQIACYHEAAMYVSGDTYFAHFNFQSKIVSFMVNDVTGHGIQAALKASGCHILAKTIWESSKVQDSTRKQGERLADYDTMIQEFVVETDSVPDFNSMVGAEFDIENGHLSIYRSNFTFPIIFSPIDLSKNNLVTNVETIARRPNEYEAKVVSCKNQRLWHCKVLPHSFVVFLSDGFMDSSKDYKKLLEYVVGKLASTNDIIDAKLLNEIILAYPPFSLPAVDDRTLLVFYWSGKSALSLAA